MKHEPNSHINERLHTGLAQSGRAAGMGISYDRYDDESGNPDYDPHDTRVRLPSDGLTEDKLAALSGAVRVTKGANICNTLLQFHTEKTALRCSKS